MQYLLIIYDVEAGWGAMPEAERNQRMAEYNSLTADLKTRGKLVGANRLAPTHTASTVRVRNGATQVTDGPYAETREQLGGYYLIEAADIAEARAVAARIPSARGGAVEVRPLHQETR